MGRNISTNIYDYNKVNLRRMSEAKRSEYLTSIWRQIGIILTIPFHYDSTANSWGILANNVRIFPQYDGVDPLTYYYNGGSTYEEQNENPLMYVPVAKGVTNLTLNSTRQFTMVENALLTAINCPADLRRFYKIIANRGTTLYVPSEETSPTTINFQIQITRLIVKTITLPVDFYLTPRT